MSHILPEETVICIKLPNKIILLETFSL